MLYNFFLLTVRISKPECCSVASPIFAIKARSLLVEWNTVRLHSRLRSGLKYKHKTILKKLARLFWLTISDE
jgi:hypothetical protein